MKIIFCLPGNTFSGIFLQNFVILTDWCRNNKIDFQICNYFSSYVTHSRNHLMQGTILRPTIQAPFDGKIEYDYLMWIDSDMVFTPENLKKLIDVAESKKYKKDYVFSGVYYQTIVDNTTIIEKWIDKEFTNPKNQLMTTRQQIKERKEPFTADAIGWGWVLVRKGFFEQIPYPWFDNLHIKVGDKEEITSEDFGLCLKAKKQKLKIWIDPTNVVGHEKHTVIQ